MYALLAARRHIPRHHGPDEIFAFRAAVGIDTLGPLVRRHGVFLMTAIA
jgi:hypothetical protein